MTGVLAIDSVSDIIAVAFAVPGEAATMRTHHGEQDHSQVLLSLVDDVCGGRRDAIGAIVVVRGPGAYTGVRVGLATAQGLAIALGIPVTGVGTLEAIATAARESGRTGPVRAIHSAGRGDFAVQHFDADNAPGELALVHGEELRGDDLAGEGAGERGGTEIGSEQRCFAAIQRFQDGLAGPAEAVYVREPHITVARKTPVAGPETRGTAQTRTEE